MSELFNVKFNTGFMTITCTSVGEQITLIQSTNSCKECHKTESHWNHTTTDHKEGEQLEDRRNDGENSCKRREVPTWCYNYDLLS